MLPLVEGSHKYFRRVIVQSGTPVVSRTIKQSIDDTNELMNMLGCKTVADLQKVDVEELVKATKAFSMRLEPEKDGKYLPLDPYEAYANGAAKDIDIMQGCNKDEMNYFLAESGGAEPSLELISKRWAKTSTQLTDEEKALVDSFCKDIK